MVLYLLHSLYLLKMCLFSITSSNIISYNFLSKHFLKRKLFLFDYVVLEKKIAKTVF